MEILGYTQLRRPDLGDPPGGAPGPNGWDRAFETQVLNGFAYVSHGGTGGAGRGGFSIVDVRNPRNMKPIFRHVNDTPDNSQYISLQDHILVVKRNSKLVMWDVRNPFSPVQLSTFTPPGILVGAAPTCGAPPLPACPPEGDPHAHGSFGYHGLWVHKDGRGGRYAYASVRLEDYTDQILIIVDITKPEAPEEIGRWWYPGMWHMGGEVQTWPTNDGSPGQTGTPVQCHDITTYGDRAYVAWRDKGIIILDISNPRTPTRLGEINWGDVSRANFAPIASQVHSIGVVVPKRGRKVETVMAGDEVGRCPGGYMHIVDVRNEARPQEISNFMTPFNRGGNCPYDRPVGRSAMHDVDRMIRGKIAWAAWEEGGFWGADISDIHNPKPAAWYVPPVRSDSSRKTSHGDDMTTGMDGSASGLVFGNGSDAGAGGLWAFRYNPGYSATVRWNSDETNVIVTPSKVFGGGRKDDDDDDDDR